MRLYDRLFIKENPLNVEEGHDWIENLNPNSVIVLQGCKLEPSLAKAGPGDRFQCDRKGYFCVDPDSTPEKIVFNRTETLRNP